MPWYKEHTIYFLYVLSYTVVCYLNLFSYFMLAALFIIFAFKFN